MDNLPYTLTKGVIATREGIEFDTEETAALIGHYYAGKERLVTPWPDAAERLHIKPIGQCAIIDETGHLSMRGNGEVWANPKKLDKLVFQLVDDAEAFKVLHQCIEEFGG